MNMIRVAVKREWSVFHFDLVQQLVAMDVNCRLVLHPDSLDQTLSIPEVVLESRRIALIGGPVDLAQRDRVNASLGK
jgi:hypothetical protein